MSVFKKKKTKKTKKVAVIVRTQFFPSIILLVGQLQSDAYNGMAESVLMKRIRDVYQGCSHLSFSQLFRKQSMPYYLLIVPLLLSQTLHNVSHQPSHHPLPPIN